MRSSILSAASEAGLGTRLAMKHFDNTAEKFISALEESAASLEEAGYPEAELLRKKILQHGGCSKYK